MAKKKLKIYLAGAMEKKRDRGATWRRNIETFLTKRGHTVYNPVTDEDKTIAKDFGVTPQQLKHLDKSSRLYQEIAHAIWERDMELIRDCDEVLVYLDEPVFRSSGTLCEMSHAKDYGITVSVIKKVAWDKIPLWTIASCDRVFKSVKHFKEAYA